MATNVTYDQVSSDAQIALTEFVDELTLALLQTPTEQWAEQLGIVRVSNKLRAKFPVPVSAAGYKEFEGDLRYRSIFQKSISVTPRLFQDGVSELLRIIESDEFVGWDDEPNRMAIAAMSQANELVAALLEAGTTTAHEWDSQFFFDTDHPINIFDVGLGTFSNDFTGAGTDLTLANLKLGKQRFREIKGPNDKPLGLRGTHLMVAPADEENAKDLLEQDLVIQAVGGDFGAVDNRHKGTLKLVVNDQLTDANAWYMLAMNKPGMRPWGIQKRRALPEVRILGRDSAMYEKELKVGVDAILDMGAALLLPHPIQRWEGTAA